MPEPSESLLTLFLASRDQPCPQCEYNLRDLRGTRCPECGEDLVLRVNMAEPRQSLLIAGLIGLSAGAGLNGLLLIYWFIQWARDQHFGGDVFERFFCVNAIGLLVEGAATWLWLKSWRKIRRQPIRRRTALMLGCWGLTLANIVVFSLTIR